MGNPNKRKGTAWETDGCRYLNTALGQIDEWGQWIDPTDPDNVRRQAQEGARDVGDAWARPFVLEFKNEQRHNFAAYVRQAEKEAEHAGLPFGVAVVKRRGASTPDAYVVMSMRTFARVLGYLRALRDTATV